MLAFLLAISIVLEPSGVFRATGIADVVRRSAQELSLIFLVQVDSAEGANLPPLLGTYTIQKDEVVFVPRYPLQPGLAYRATLKLPDGQTLTQRLVPSKPDAQPTTIVEHVYPSTNVLPENQLKFYIYFSAGMSRGEAYRHLHLIDDDNGQEVQMPFLELNQELWDQEGHRFTLYFDPGRIKSGLLPHDQSGLAIREGKKYSLVVDPDWLDANGRPLKQVHRKVFSVGPAERGRLDLSEWRVTAPRAASADAISIEFPKPLDRALLEHELEIIDSSGRLVDGSIEIDRDEMRWRLTPASQWKAGTYSARVGSNLSDLAGNMLDRPFEIDTFENAQQTRARENRALPFKIE